MSVSNTYSSNNLAVLNLKTMLLTFLFPELKHQVTALSWMPKQGNSAKACEGCDLPFISFPCDSLASYWLE
jgi:hypothetical protein